jgi:hypothetical protein
MSLQFCLMYRTTYDGIGGHRWVADPLAIAQRYLSTWSVPPRFVRPSSARRLDVRLRPPRRAREWQRMAAATAVPVAAPAVAAVAHVPIVECVLRDGVA